MAVSKTPIAKELLGHRGVPNRSGTRKTIQATAEKLAFPCRLCGEKRFSRARRVLRGQPNIPLLLFALEVARSRYARM
jgi:predicted RNA-binding Zn-ribbon protein involved in translation (DUF1610 family)